MSAVTVLANAPQARSGESDALSVAEFSTLRLDLLLTADHGVQPYITTYLESGPTADGPFTVLDERHYSRAFPGKERIVVAGFDAFIRLRWSGGSENESITRSYGPPYSPTGGTLTGERGAIDPGFVIGLTGDGQPDAA